MGEPLSRTSRTPVLRGNIVVLRPVTVDDVPGLINLLHDEEVRRLTGTHGPVRPGVHQRATEYYDSRADDESSVHLAVCAVSDGRYLGESVLNEIDTQNLKCSFRIALTGDGVTNRGVGTEATHLMTDYALSGLNLHRVELEVLATNPRARRVYEKAGFVREGVKRDAVRWDGQWIDLELMARLAR